MKNTITLNNTYNFLLTLTPIALITGPFLPDSFASLGALIFIVITFKDILARTIYINEFVIICFAFYFYILLRSFFVNDILVSLEVSLFYFRHIFFALSIVYFFLYLNNSIKFLYYSIFISLLIVSIDGYIQYFFKVNLLGWSPVQSNRLGGLFGNELILGSYISMLFPILIALKYKLSKSINYYVFYFSIYLYPLIFFTGERTAFIIFSIYIFFLLIILPFNKKIIFSFIITLCTIALLIFSTESKIKDKMIFETIEEIKQTKFKYIIHTPAHEPMYNSSIKMFRDSPLFGQGPGMFEVACHYNKFFEENSCNTHPHNHYIQALAEIGIFGFSFIFIFFIFLFYSLIKGLIFLFFYDDKDKIIKLIFFLPIFLNLIPFFPNRDFYNNWDNVIYFLSLGLMLYILEYNKKFK